MWQMMTSEGKRGLFQSRDVPGMDGDVQPYLQQQFTCDKARTELAQEMGDPRPSEVQGGIPLYFSGVGCIHFVYSIFTTA